MTESSIGPAMWIMHARLGIFVTTCIIHANEGIGIGIRRGIETGLISDTREE